MPILKTISGDVNLKGRSAKVIVFYSPKGGGTERFLSQAARDGESGVVVRHTLPSPAVAGAKPEICGCRWDSTYEVREGTVFKIFTRINPGNGKMEKVANFYIRVREDAAYRAVTINTLDVAEVNFRAARIEGNFDMLSVDEAIAEGVKCLPQHRGFADPIAVERVVTSNVILAEEKNAKAKLEMRQVTDGDSGGVVAFAVRKRRRAIG